MAAPSLETEKSARPPTRARKMLSHLGIMTGVSVAMGLVVAGLALPVVGFVGTSANDAADLMEELPLDLEATPLAQKTSVLDVEGNLVASFYDENRITVPLDQIAKPMIQAIVSIEDYRYYQHGAIDLKGTLRALLTNQAADGVVQGGSSITQQMVKLTLVDQAETKEERQAATDDTYARKIKELRYAIAFEENYSKDWILERYLNIAYFGDGAYGVQAAARRYFNKNASKLTVKEAATLAGLVKNPVGYDPTTYPDRALSRRNVVLERMAQLNVIPTSEAAKLKKRGLGLDVQPAANGCVNAAAPFFCDFVYRYLLADPSLGETRDERKDLLNSGGLTIRTTLDMAHQRAADDSVRAAVFPTDQAIGGLAMVEPRTGHVRALAQSRPMGDNSRKGETYLNYVVNEEYGDSAGFTAGSTFKLFVLAAALQKGEMSMRQQINSPQQMTLPEASFEDCGGVPYGYGQWTMNNSTGSGSYDMYTGTQQSVNTYFAQLTQHTGICEPFELAVKMGVDLDNPEGDERGLGAERTAAFGLGFANASPLEMAEAYATFAGRGLHCDALPVTSIEDADGNVLKEYNPRCEQVLRGAVADAVNDVLRGVQEHGFGAQNGLRLSRQSAAKTGTGQDQKAVWFVGYTPTLSTAAMIAGANSQGQPIGLRGQTIGGRYIGSASGSGFAGPMWGNAMKAVADSLPDDQFQRPSGSDILGVQVSVPDVTGQPVESALEELEAAGFNARQGNSVNSMLAEGMVSYTSPSAGSGLSNGDTVFVHASNGNPPPKPEPTEGKRGKKQRDD